MNRCYSSDETIRKVRRRRAELEDVDVAAYKEAAIQYWKDVLTQLEAGEYTPTAYEVTDFQAWPPVEWHRRKL